MFAKLLDEWALERAENMMLLPSDDTRKWLEDFASWLDQEAAQQSVQRTAETCPCPCHVGQPIVHMWNCCGAPFSRR